MMFLMEKSKAGADCAATGAGEGTVSAMITAGESRRAQSKELPITSDFRGGLVGRGAVSAIAKKRYSENYHPERKQIIVDRGEFRHAARLAGSNGTSVLRAGLRPLST